MIRKNLLIFMIFLMTGSVYAGVTGKIAGIVVDAKNGEPLPGVNIILEGTLMGASSESSSVPSSGSSPPFLCTSSLTIPQLNRSLLELPNSFGQKRTI